MYFIIEDQLISQIINDSELLKKNHTLLKQASEINHRKNQFQRQDVNKIDTTYCTKKISCNYK